ncbi:Smr/MutS family protein [Salinicola sp. LHM]|uniref:Smr/MutS family protein n=1 Tax=Salinicola sp. LHM TaxID=3065298 RepID=UPI002ACE5A4E|nr:Smr/MutS family protein [Salinicola sp. LHM]WQH31783.1 Smr/MutS family protein [Salinicola sp. LHM]
MTHSSSDDDDHNAFRQALEAAGVQRLKLNRAATGRPRRNALNADARREAAEQAPPVVQSRLSDGGVEAVTPHQRLEFSIPDLPPRTFAQLKRGHIAWEGGLDLHGYTLDEARVELESFIDDAIASRVRCVLVVHGKARGYRGSGADYPVIKSHVNTWLKNWSRVLAFCSASEIDGGTGALYVLLRTRGD